MTRNQDQQTAITDHECIARSREGTRSPKIPPPGPNHPAKPFDGTTDASESAPLSAATDETMAKTDL